MQLAAVLPAKGHNQDFKETSRRVESKIPYCVIGFSEKLPEAASEDTILSGVERC